MATTVMRISLKINIFNESKPTYNINTEGKIADNDEHQWQNLHATAPKNKINK